MYCPIFGVVGVVMTTTQTSMDSEKNWLDRVIEGAQKEVDKWPKLKREMMEHEVDRKHFQQDNTSYGNL